MGVAAGHYIAAQLKAKGVSNPVIAEIQGIANLPLTQDRGQGLRRRAQAGRLQGEQPGRRPSSPSSPASRSPPNLLQAAPKIDAIWNHDDDQGVGVLAAIDQAEPQGVLHGRRRRLARTRWTPSRPTTRVLKATVTYPPSMASSAIKLARLIAQGKGMSDLVELEVPALDHAGQRHGHQGERRQVPAAGLQVLTAGPSDSDEPRPGVSRR